MPKLGDLQYQFMQVLLGDNPAQLSNAIVNQGELSNLTRIDIYRNAYYQRLKESIDIDHQILGTYLGDELFEKMVTGYISLYPSKQTSLRYYSEKLPNFLANTQPFSDFPVLTELARFERALLTAFDAPDAELASTTMLGEVLPKDWPTLQFRLHPSVQLYTSQLNGVEIWQAIKQEQIPPSPVSQQQNWLIWRNNERLTEFNSLNDFELTMLEAMITGADYAEICENLAEQLPVEQVSEASLQSLVKWLDIGVISRLSNRPTRLSEI